jgi:hypothetical protein
VEIFRVGEVFWKIKLNFLLPHGNFKVFKFFSE